MPEQPRPLVAARTPAATGVVTVERRLVLIVAAFGLLYSLQNLDGLIADWPSLAGPLGAFSAAAVMGSCVIALLAVPLRSRSRQVFTVAVLVYALGALLMPFALHGALPASPPPWITSMWPIEAVFLCGATTRISVPLVATGAAAVGLALLLAGPGRLDPVAISHAVLPMCAICVVLVLLIGALRHRIRHAEQSRRVSLDQYQRSQRDAATEAERIRTDALMHDSVLTTLLAAAAADSVEDEELAGRMAANALRVLAHVNGRDERGDLLPFTLLLQHARRVAPEAFLVFKTDTRDADDVALPAAAADAVLAAMVQAMDNSVRHAGEAGRSLTAEPLGPDGVRVVVTDTGVGFDTASAIAAGRGLHRGVVERMRQVDGRADVVSAPSEGTRVTISWGSVVVSGTRPLLAGEVVAR
jgi:signal transduction histidine kinase